MRKLYRATIPLLAATLCAGVTPCHAAALDIFTDLPSFVDGAGNGHLLTQGFQEFTTEVDISGIDVLPGVSATFNLGALKTMNEMTRRILGTGDRTSRNAQYDITLGVPYTSFAFEIAAFQADDDPANQNIAAPDAPGTVTVTFGDGSLGTFDVYGNNGSPIFVGLVADTPIVTVSWAEALTKSGRRNETTTLDNFSVLLQVPASATLALLRVPAPATLALAALGLLGAMMPLGGRARRVARLPAPA